MRKAEISYGKTPLLAPLNHFYPAGVSLMLVVYKPTTDKHVIYPTREIGVVVGMRYLRPI